MLPTIDQQLCCCRRNSYDKSKRETSTLCLHVSHSNHFLSHFSWIAFTTNVILISLSFAEKTRKGFVMLRCFRLRQNQIKSWTAFSFILLLFTFWSFVNEKIASIAIKCNLFKLSVSLVIRFCKASFLFILLFNNETYWENCMIV